MPTMRDTRCVVQARPVTLDGRVYIEEECSAGGNVIQRRPEAGLVDEGPVFRSSALIAIAKTTRCRPATASQSAFHVATKSSSTCGEVHAGLTATLHASP